MQSHFLDSIRHIYRAVKTTGDGALAQCSFDDLMRVPVVDGNSIAIIVGHLHGNMRSRWTDFLTSDGEKPWRTRDAEFDAPPVADREAVLKLWDDGWQCVFAALDALTPADLEKQVQIRGQAHTVIEAVHRQLQHYSYHVGQIVLLARLWKATDWHTLSIARGQSQSYTPSGRGGEPPISRPPKHQNETSNHRSDCPHTRMEHKLYSELAEWWPLISDPADYAGEAEFWRTALRQQLGPGRHRILEFGVGGGNNLSHLVGEFEAVAVDLSPAMLDHSRRLNPGVEHLVGDMRTVDLGRTFDAVLIHDAICYLTNLGDVAQTMRNVARHLRPGGMFIGAPDYVRENFPADDREALSSISQPRRSVDGKIEIVHAEYVFDPDPTDATYESVMVVWLRRRPADVRVIEDRHTCGMFSKAEWQQEIERAGMIPATLDYPVHDDGRPGWLFTGIKP